MNVGIIGAGQLGRMLALAGYPIGIRCLFLDRDAASPGGQVGEIIVAELDDVEQLNRLAAAVEVITFDIENVAVGALAQIRPDVAIYPSAEALAVAQDRLEEKRLFESLSIPTAPYVPIACEADLTLASRTLGRPLVLKARRMGYDGRGQRIVESEEGLKAAWRDLGNVPALAEGWIDFERELSLLAVKGAEGEQAFYPLVENVHGDGILISSSAPYEDGALQSEAEGWLSALLDRFDYRGVLTAEFFHTGSGLIANEIAPRVHNSGHWTIEGAETSQFENHLRAVVGLPLGDTSPRGYAAMVNLIGSMPQARELLRIPGVHLHDYGKEPRANRKLGHCTVVQADRQRLSERLQALRSAVGLA